jgi:hypothetical protein
MKPGEAQPLDVGRELAIRLDAEAGVFSGGDVPALLAALDTVRAHRDHVLAELNDLRAQVADGEQRKIADACAALAKLRGGK